jgi:methylmalonyl-CoA mutase
LGADADAFPAWSEADWRKAAEVTLKGASVGTLSSRTADGIQIEPVYAASEGPRPLTPDGPWRVIARLDNPDPGEANAQALDDLARGADGLQVIFSGAVGAYGFGLRRSDPGSLHAAFDGVPFDAQPRFELDLGRRGVDQALGFAALVERSGARPADCAVSFGLDPFAVCTFGPLPIDWAAHVKPCIDAAIALKSKGFGGPLVVADARSVHSAGGTPGQELAFALGAAVSLLRALNGAGVSLGEARERIAFRLAADADEFVTLSKFRALRLTWARVEEACGLEPRPAHVQVESAWRMMTARDPYANVMRGAMAAISAGLGGADSVSVLPHTLAVGLPDSFARRLARNGQLILLRESHLGFVADSAAGAGAFDALTEALCNKGWTLFQELEAQGGLPAALAGGTFRHQIAESARALVRDVARLKSQITGVSVHADLREGRVEVALGAPEREGVPVAEGALAPMRLSEPFETLRDESDALLVKRGSRPKAFIVALGPEASHRRRVAYVREWLEAGGIEPVYEGEVKAPDQAIGRLSASGASLAFLCGDDAAYASEGVTFATALKASGIKGLSLVGHPQDAEDALRAAGVDEFIFAGGDAIATLRRLYRNLTASALDERP